MERETAIRKIQKCLALSASSEPHEAARALRQAQALMHEYGIEHPEILSAGVEQGWSKSRAVESPPSYEIMLANSVADAFGCKLIFVPKWISDTVKNGGYAFIGFGPSAEIASYTFTVLARKLIDARGTYTKEKLRRYRKNKVAAADAFCVGWVSAVSRQVSSAYLENEGREALDAYMEIHYSSRSEIKPGRRELADTERAEQHHTNGWIEGKKTVVHTGVAGDSRPALINLDP